MIGLGLRQGNLWLVFPINRYWPSQGGTFVAVLFDLCLVLFLF